MKIATHVIAFTLLFFTNPPVTLSERAQWTTSNIYGSPDPPSRYRIKRSFPQLKFDEPVAMALIPGTNRMVVVERYGKLKSFEHQPSASTTELFFDLAKALNVEQLQTYGITFHPQYEQNGYVFLAYRRDGENPTRVARFRVPAGDPMQIDPHSKKLIIAWPGGHDGGCLKFGPDGFLYISNGDRGGLHDPGEVGQGLDELQSSIIRIDVNVEDDSAYAIPSDNPFIDQPDARPEIWAYGFRNPWRMSFDRDTGDLWTADVGEDLWESVHLVVKAGNYGWSVMEGGHPFRPQRQRGPTPIRAPIIAHDHSAARSITGGYVYRGKTHSELFGHYIYGDYDTGKVWSLKFDGTQITRHEELCDTTLRLVAFTETKEGELYLIDHIGGQIFELERNHAVDTSIDFPRRLSETGLFRSTEQLTPATGLIEYDVIVPQWCDGATKQRYMALPDFSQIEFETITFPGRGGRHGWKFPDGAVLVETLSIEMEVGNPASQQRLETRILHHERLNGSEQVGDQYWRGYTYVWNDEQTDALLLEDPQGMDRSLLIQDASAPDGQREQTWHFPSRTECATCHNMAAKYVLGCQTLQMNRSSGHALHRNQIDHLRKSGIFAAPLPPESHELPKLTDFRREDLPLADRARSYLHANCSHCHRNGGGGNAPFFALASIDLKRTRMIDTRPSQSSFYIPQAAIVKPGDPFRSMIYYRMNVTGGSRMPRLGSQVVHDQAVNLIFNWIHSLPSSTAETVSSSPILNEQQVSKLLQTTVGAEQLARAIRHHQIEPSLAQKAVALGNQGPTQIRDLLEPFLPEQERVKRLGNRVDVAAILRLEGNAERGADLFATLEGLQCRKCHRVNGKGQQVGPDLDQIGKRYDRRQILTSILEPSKNIDTKFLQYHCETADGLTVSGILVEQDEHQVVLRDAQAKLIRIPANEVEQLSAQSKSLMPDLLFRDLTAQQLADLAEYLFSLR